MRTILQTNKNWSCKIHVCTNQPITYSYSIHPLHQMQTQTAEHTMFKK